MNDKTKTTLSYLTTRFFALSLVAGALLAGGGQADAGPLINGPLINGTGTSSHSVVVDGVKVVNGRLVRR